MLNIEGMSIQCFMLIMLHKVPNLGDIMMEYLLKLLINTNFREYFDHSLVEIKEGEHLYQILQDKQYLVIKL
jgi:hypothetical protein